MSSKKSNRKSAKKNQATPGTTAKILGQFEGNISARGELHIGSKANCKANIRANKVRVDGSFTGNVAADRTMSVSNGAKCKGSFHVDTLKVDGVIEGQAVVRDRMDLSPTSQMKGQIVANRLIVADGASFSGKCTIGKFFSTGSNGNKSRKAA